MIVAKKKKILVVEDEKPIATALELKLNGSGFDAKVALNGEEGVEMIKNEKFDLILLDLVMPRMNGFDFLEEMQRMGVKIPVIVTSNLSQQEDIEKAKILGVDDYFIKSNVSISQVVEHIEGMLSRKGRVV